MRRRREARAAPYLFLLPAGLLFSLFIVLPVGYAIFLSLRRAQVEGGFIGKQVEGLGG